MFINYMLSALKPNRTAVSFKTEPKPNRTRDFFQKQNRTEVQKSIPHIPTVDLKRVCYPLHPSTPSVTSMILQLGLPNSNTLMHNYCFRFGQRITLSDSCLVQRLRWLH